MFGSCVSSWSPWWFATTAIAASVSIIIIINYTLIVAPAYDLHSNLYSRESSVNIVYTHTIHTRNAYLRRIVIARQDQLYRLCRLQIFIEQSPLLWVRAVKHRIFCMANRTSDFISTIYSFIYSKRMEDVRSENSGRFFWKFQVSEYEIVTETRLELGNWFRYFLFIFLVASCSAARMRFD